jgi:hypothetical protein
MALKISKNSGLTDLVSSGTGANPVTTSHPTTGSTSSAIQLWLFNDNSAAYTYSNVNVDPTDATGGDESTWVQLSTDGSTWQAAGAALSLTVTGSTGTTFYYRCVVPSGQTVQNKSDIKLTVNYRETAV